MDKRALHPPTSFLVLLMTMLLLLPVWSEQFTMSARSSDQDEEDEESMGQLSQQEMQQIRERIMRSLGLTREPDVSKVNISAEERAEAYRTYLHRLQEKQRHHMLTRDLEDEEEPEEEEEEERVDDEEGADQKPQKYTFQATVSSDGLRRFPVRLHFSLNIPFNASTSSVASPVDFSSLSQLRSATLRLLGLPLNNQNATTRPRPPLVTLFVYQVSGSQRTLVAHKRVLVVPDRQLVWETMDVTQALTSWPGWHETNASVVLEVDCDGCEDVSETAAERMNVSSLSLNGTDEDIIDVSANISRLHLNTSSNDGNFTPVDIFLDTMFDGSAARREKRETRHRKHKSNKKRTSELELYKGTWPSGGAESTDCKKGTRGKCCRHHMYVNFTLLQMTYVIEPQGFDAHYCKGKCTHHYNPAHTHALIQSSMHAHKKAPRPCCAPSKLSNLTIMHYDERMEKIIITDWTNAVVDECACS